MKKLQPVLHRLLVTIAIIAVPEAQSAVSLDRTRAIYNGEEKSMTLSVANDNNQLPYLAQAWLENEKQEKITSGPIVVTPPLQRLEPGAKSMVRLAVTPDITKLPQDKETLFYFNLREIPPKSESANVLQIALHTKIKLFYRPKSIETLPNSVWQDKLVLNKVSGGYKIENPTPYYITIIGLGSTKKQAMEGEFNAVMIAPKSEETVKAGHYAIPYLSYINDYGGRPVLEFKCTGNRCIANSK